MEEDRDGEDSILLNVSSVEVARTNPKAKLAPTQPDVQIQTMLKPQLLQEKLIMIRRIMSEQKKANFTIELNKEIAMMKSK